MGIARANEITQCNLPCLFAIIECNTNAMHVFGDCEEFCEVRTISWDPRIVLDSPVRLSMSHFEATERCGSVDTARASIR